MAIVLKYGSPGPLLQAGFAAGVGHRKNDQQDDLLKIWQQQTQQGFQYQQAALTRQQQAALQQQSQNFQADQNAQSRYFHLKGQEFQAEQNRLRQNALDVRTQSARFDRAGQADLAREQQLLIQKNRDEALRVRNTEEGLQKGQLELPEAAKRKLDQLEAGLVDALSLDPAQQEEFRQKYEKQKRELLGFARPKAKLSPEEQFQKNTFEKDGTLYQMTDKGLDVLKDSGKQTEKAHADAANYSKTLHAEMVRMQKAGMGDDSVMKPLDSYLEDARKGLAAAGITPPQPQQASTGNPFKAASDDYFSTQPNVTTGQEQEGVTYTKRFGDQYSTPVTAPLQQAPTSVPFQASAPQPAQSSYTPEMRKSILENSQLPRPQSAEEAAALGKGASWVAPDGTIRRNP